VSRFCDLIWPTLDRLEPHELAAHADADRSDETFLNQANILVDPKVVLDEAHRIESGEEDRRKTAEAKASNVLLVLAAVIPLLTYLETAIWDAKLGTAPRWITLLVLVIAVVYLMGAIYWAFKAISVSSYHTIGAVDLVRNLTVNEGAILKLAKDVLVGARRNQAGTNDKVSAVKMTHEFMRRAVFVFCCLLLVQATFELLLESGIWHGRVSAPATKTDVLAASLGPQDERASAGPAGPVGPQGERGEPGMQLRQVRQMCSATRTCTVSCGDGETAINASCPVGSAKLVNARQVTCGRIRGGEMTALCVK
jgi:hypothetical protein